MIHDASNVEGSPHHFLNLIAGTWIGETNTWLEPNGKPIVSPTQGSIQLLLKGRFAMYIYQSSLDGEPLHGILTVGYNTDLDRYEATWIDSYHNNTAMMFCTGDPIENGFWVRGSYPDPEGGPDWGWRTEIIRPDVDHLTITAYNIAPEGQEDKAIETHLARTRG